MATEIVTKVSIPDTLRAMKKGETIICEAAKTASYITAYSAVRRMNESGKYGEFEISSSDNGVTYAIKRVA